MPATAREKVQNKRAKLRNAAPAATATPAPAEAPSPPKKGGRKGKAAATPASEPPANGANGVQESAALSDASKVEANLTKAHEAFQEADKPVDHGEALDAAVAAAYEPPDEADAEEAAAVFTRTDLISAVERAMSFAPKGSKDTLDLACYANTVCGHSQLGVTVVPWTVPGIPAGECWVLDGKELLKVLKKSAPDAELRSISDTVVEVRSKNGKFRLPRAAPVFTFPTFPPPESYVDFDPALFRIAAKFIADGKLETGKPALCGVHLGERVEATDQYSVLFSSLVANPAPLGLAVHKDTFNDLPSPVKVARLNDWLFVYSPATGEHRAVRAFGDSFPDVGAVMRHVNASFVVSLDIEEFREAVKRARIAQKRTAPVRVTLGDGEETGAFLEMRAGSLDKTEFLHRLPARITSFDPAKPPPTAEGLVKLAYNLDALEKLAAIADGGHLYFAPHEASAELRKFYYLGATTPNVCIAWASPTGA